MTGYFHIVAPVHLGRSWTFLKLSRSHHREASVFIWKIGARILFGCCILDERKTVAPLYVLLFTVSNRILDVAWSYTKNPSGITMVLSTGKIWCWTLNKNVHHINGRNVNSPSKFKFQFFRVFGSSLHCHISDPRVLQKKQQSPGPACSQSEPLNIGQHLPLWSLDQGLDPNSNWHIINRLSKGFTLILSFCLSLP